VVVVAVVHYADVAIVAWRWFWHGRGQGDGQGDGGGSSDGGGMTSSAVGTSRLCDSKVTCVFPCRACEKLDLGEIVEIGFT
jgi:hypothetical protein